MQHRSVMHRPRRHSHRYIRPHSVPRSFTRHCGYPYIHHAHLWALFALFALRRGTKARATGQVGAEAEHVVYFRVAPLVPVCGVSHQPDSSTFRELMTRRVDTDITCSRGKAGTVGYAAMACCLLQDYSSTYAKTDRPLFAQRYLALPSTASLFGRLKFRLPLGSPAKPCSQPSARPPVLAAPKTLRIRIISPAEGISQTWCNPWGAGALCNRQDLY